MCIDTKAIKASLNSPLHSILHQRYGHTTPTHRAINTQPMDHNIFIGCVPIFYSDLAICLLATIDYCSIANHAVFVIHRNISHLGVNIFSNILASWIAILPLVYTQIS